MNKKIIVYGMGYVGLSNAILLAQHNEVLGIEINQEKVHLLNKKISPINDKEIIEYLSTKDLNFAVKSSDRNFAKTADYVIIATPTNFDEDKNYFDTSSVDSVLENLSSIKSTATVIIKSTIPIYYTQKVKERYKNLTILFSPEFLREGKALYDNLYPSRIIVGCNILDKQDKEQANEFAELLKNGALKSDMPILIMDYTEAECVKLFSNTYLAMRVAYINELDNFAIKNNLNTKQIIEGMCADPRIGNFYNNPSFGYGGYCFPKDTKQLKANYEGIPNSLITAIVESNTTRKNFIADYIISETNPDDIIGIYRLIMKSESDNCRSSAIFDIINKIAKDRKLIIFEPRIKSLSVENCYIESNLNNFKTISKIIIANRIDKNILDVKDKIFTRDIYGRD